MASFLILDMSHMNHNDMVRSIIYISIHVTNPLISVEIKPQLNSDNSQNYKVETSSSIHQSHGPQIITITPELHRLSSDHLGYPRIISVILGSLWLKHLALRSPRLKHRTFGSAQMILWYSVETSLYHVRGKFQPYVVIFLYSLCSAHEDLSVF